MFNFCKRFFTLTRNQASIIMQLQTRHIPINNYLEKIGKINSKNCNECNANNPENPIVESINHFLFECPAHEHFRWDLICVQ